MAGSSEPDEILKTMQEKYPRAKVVLTLGNEGSIYQDGNRRVGQESIAVQAVDTTAAGDTFTGYFIAGLLKEMEPEEILQMCAKAAIAVSREGAAASIPASAEVEKWFSR